MWPPGAHVASPTGTGLRVTDVGVATLPHGTDVVGNPLVVVHTLPRTADGVGVFIDGKS
jgi:hypothetical protein